MKIVFWVGIVLVTVGFFWEQARVAKLRAENLNRIDKINKIVDERNEKMWNEHRAWVAAKRKRMGLE